MTTTKLPLAVIAGLGVVGALAGCSAPADSDAGADGTTSAISGPYTDGTYEATGDYQAPSGTESVDVTVTLKGDVITDVQVVGGATDPTAQQHQGEFIDGIGAVVVGKSIDDIQVDKVGGSSLTSGGFNKAIEAIKADAVK